MQKSKYKLSDSISHFRIKECEFEKQDVYKILSKGSRPLHFSFAVIIIDIVNLTEKESNKSFDEFLANFTTPSKQWFISLRDCLKKGPRDFDSYISALHYLILTLEFSENTDYDEIKNILVEVMV